MSEGPGVIEGSFTDLGVREVRLQIPTSETRGQERINQNRDITEDVLAAIDKNNLESVKAQKRLREVGVDPHWFDPDTLANRPSTKIFVEQIATPIRDLATAASQKDIPQELVGTKSKGFKEQERKNILEQIARDPAMILDTFYRRVNFKLHPEARPRDQYAMGADELNNERTVRDLVRDHKELSQQAASLAQSTRYIEGSPGKDGDLVDSAYDIAALPRLVKGGTTSLTGK